MRDECEATGRDPALMALGRCAAVLLREDGAAILLHDTGADPTAREALLRLSHGAALGAHVGETFDAAGFAADAGLSGAFRPRTCAAREAENGGLIVLAAWDRGVRRVAVRAALDALGREVRRRGLARPGGRAPAKGSAPSPFEAVFENAAHCMAVVGANRRLHAVNRAGRRVLGEGRLLLNAGGRLRALDPAQDRRLAEALKGRPRGDGPSVVLLTASPGAPGLRCEIGRIDLPSDGPPPLGPRFLLTAAPIAAGAPVEALLARAFGLTQAEARLAAALVAGHDLRAASERLGVSHHTARKYLQIAFSKMGVRRQADLVRRALEIVHDPATSTA